MTYPVKNTRIRPARGDFDLAQIRQLFSEYQQFLGVDLCFQGFQEELASLPGKYRPPQGELLIAEVETGEGQWQVAGCVGVRPLDDRRCEMKRLYVRPEFQGLKLGRRLAEAIVGVATEMGYQVMQLDTLRRLSAAIHLYRSMGFVPTEAYYDNPLEQVVYLSLPLQDKESV